MSLKERLTIENTLKEMGVSNTQIENILFDPQSWLLFYKDRYQRGKTVATIPPENIPKVFTFVESLTQ